MDPHPGLDADKPRPGSFAGTQEQGSVGVQGELPPNVPQQHMDYSELKLLKKRPM